MRPTTLMRRILAGSAVASAAAFAVVAVAPAASAHVGTATITCSSVTFNSYANFGSGSQTVPNPILLNGGRIFGNDSYQHVSGALNVTANGGTLGSTYEGDGTNGWNFFLNYPTVKQACYNASATVTFTGNIFAKSANTIAATRASGAVAMLWGARRRR